LCKPGAALFGVFDRETLLAIGGINQDSADCGRLRRFYVKKTARRTGIGRQLAQHLLAFAAHHYSRVVLFTDTAPADRFYCALGFTRVQTQPDISHEFAISRLAS
jgi:GNAT superfamily N-acetyltransferase